MLLLTTMWSDVKYGLRQMWRNPHFSIPTILTLAIGIGVAATIFTVYECVLLRPLPYPQSQQLIRLWDRNEAAGLPRFSVSPGNYFAWRERNQTLTDVGAYREDSLTFVSAAGAESVQGACVTASLLQVLGVMPLTGRPIQPQDDEPGSAAVALVTHTLAGRLGGPGSVVGSNITLGGKAHTIIGVLPVGFRFPQQEQVQLLVPCALNSKVPQRDTHFLRVLGRLRPDADLKRAHADLNLIASRLEAEFPKSNRNWAVALDTLHHATVGNVEQALTILLVAAALLMVITSANVAGLLLARITSRRSEFALRMALGAGTARIARQVIVESLLLSFAGGVVGLVLGRLALSLLIAVNPDALPRTTEIIMDAATFVAIVVASFLTGLAFSTIALLTFVLRPSQLYSLVGSGRGIRGSRQPIQRLLVAGQIAVAVPLVVGAGLLLQNLVRLQQIDPGFRTSGVLTLELSLPPSRYGEPPARVRLYKELLSRLETLPGAEAVGAVHRLPLAGNSGFRLIKEGATQEPNQAPSVNFRAVAGGYFGALGIRLERGRFFSDAEMWERGGAVMVNRALVAKYFKDIDPLQQHLIGPRGEPLEVIGIIDDVRENALHLPAEPALYFPYATSPVPSMTLLIRNSRSTESMAQPALQAIRETDPLLAPGQIQTVDYFMRKVTASPRFNTLLLGSFAAIALLLSAVGIYGVTAYAVAQRTSEIGVRIALGASGTDIFAAVLMPAIRLAVVGVIVGLGCAVLLARLLGGTILSVNAVQPGVYAVTTLLLLAVAIAATVVPARRAARLNPVAALRVE